MEQTWYQRLKRILCKSRRSVIMSLISNREIKKLKDYFDSNQVEYELMYWEEGRFNIHVDLWYMRLSFLTSFGSWGGYEGLIELYNFRDEPTGYLTADEAIEIYERVVQE